MSDVKDSQFRSRWTLNPMGDLSTIHRPWVMGVLNVTPDSFHDGGMYSTVDKALAHALEMLDEGANIIDVGGSSSRPGAEAISVDEELERTIPIISEIQAARPDALISIDTYSSIVARAAVEAGAGMINDISAGALDENMFATVAALGVPYVLMHMKGLPENMQNAPEYDDVLGEVVHFFSQKLFALHKLGVRDIILDPGFGFGKDLQHNYSLLRHLHELKIFGKPILVGLSRKRMINEVIGTNAANALNGTTVLNTLALQQNAAILRVHDVRAALECVDLFEQLKSN